LPAQPSCNEADGTTEPEEGDRTRGTGAVYVHRQSHTLSEILVELFRDSNNCIADQIFLEIGGRRLGGPVGLEKSRQVANETLAVHGLAAAIHLEEGSGISRNTSPPAASPKCSSSSRPMPTCSAAMMGA